METPLRFRILISIRLFTDKQQYPGQTKRPILWRLCGCCLWIYDACDISLSSRLSLQHCNKGPPPRRQSNRIPDDNSNASKASTSTYPMAISIKFSHYTILQHSREYDYSLGHKCKRRSPKSASTKVRWTEFRWTAYGHSTTSTKVRQQKSDERPTAKGKKYFSLHIN